MTRRSDHDQMTRPTGEARAGTKGARPPSARVPLTDLPPGLLLLLAAVGLPRTVLADLDIVPPESGLLYYVLALAPFALWLGVAVRRRSRRPLMDFVVVGLVYGLTLVLVHLALWDAPAGYGNRPPAGAVDFAEGFGAGWQDAALVGHVSAVALLIGVGSGLVAGLVAVAATAWRSRHLGP